MRWVNSCPQCGEEHPEVGEHVELRTTRRPPERAIEAVRRGDVPLPTRELAWTSQFTPARNRPLTEEEKRRG